jgi:hypothetical protein
MSSPSSSLSIFAKMGREGKRKRRRKGGNDSFADFCFCLSDAFTINAVGQDDFSDVKVPDASRGTQSQKGLK